MFKLDGRNLHDVEVLHTVLDKLTSIGTFHLEEKTDLKNIHHSLRVCIDKFDV